MVDSWHSIPSEEKPSRFKKWLDIPTLTHTGEALFSPKQVKMPSNLDNCLYFNKYKYNL